METKLLVAVDSKLSGPIVSPNSLRLVSVQINHSPTLQPNAHHPSIHVFKILHTYMDREILLHSCILRNLKLGQQQK